MNLAFRITSEAAQYRQIFVWRRICRQACFPQIFNERDKHETNGTAVVLKRWRRSSGPASEGSERKRRTNLRSCLKHAITEGNQTHPFVLTWESFASYNIWIISVHVIQFIICGTHTELSLKSKPYNFQIKGVPDRSGESRFMLGPTCYDYHHVQRDTTLDEQTARTNTVRMAPATSCALYLRSWSESLDSPDACSQLD